jgi:hypothetical protein
MNVFYQLKQIRSSLRSPLQEGNEETNNPRPDKGPTTYALEIQLLGDIFKFSMLKFRQRLIQGQRRFIAEVIPGMHAYAAATRRGWTKKEVEDYGMLEELFNMFRVGRIADS